MRILILSNPRLTEEYFEYLEALLVLFLVHDVIHLAGDVRNHGVLENFSSFKYETFLHNLKNLVRKSQSPLSQIVGHLTETP